MAKFNYVSLFSGIGGFEQALNKLGGTCVMASEFDKFAEQAYQALYGHTTAGDITKVDAKDVPNHDLLVGGFPCQSFSVAGKRKGFDDVRGTLFFDIVRIATEKQPKALLLENVKGLVNHDKGNTLDTMVRTLNEIGYIVDFDVLNSKYFGVPQNRERIFIVAIRKDLLDVDPFSEEVTTGQTIVPKGKRRIGEWADVFNFDWPDQTEVAARLRDILETEVDEKYYLDEDKTATLVAQLEDKESDNDPKIAVAGNVNPSGRGMNGQVYDINGGLSPTLTTNKGEGTKMIEEVRPVLTPDRLVKRQNGRRFKEDGEESFTLTSQDKRGVLFAQSEALKLARGFMRDDDNISVKIQNDLDLRPHRNDDRKSGVRSLTIVNYDENVSNTMTSAHEPKIYGVSTKYRIRKLTPLECFRLQGFPDSAHQTLVDAGISDSQRYKQAGNAVTVNVIEAMGKRLIPLIADGR